MGFGRSGTSLMGGILQGAGYFMGDNLYPPRHSNPKGFFENAFINGINERILSPYDLVKADPTSDCHEKAWSPFKPHEGHRWLSYIDPETEIACNDENILSDIREAASRKGFAYKDPRFNYTLDVWEPLLGEETVYICVFRDPAETIESVLRECASARYLSEFYIDRELASKLWINSYKSLLRSLEQADPGKCIFVHYEQLLSGERLDVLSEVLSTEISNDFASEKLNRTRAEFPADKRTQKLYQELCILAGYRIEGL